MTFPSYIIVLEDKISFVVSVNKKEDSRLKPEYKRKLKLLDWLLDLTKVFSTIQPQ